MPSITAVHESLPYIDHDPTAAEREAAEALITAERALVPDDAHHALLPTAYNPSFSPLIEAELERMSSANPPFDAKTNKPTKPLQAIDLTRYEASPEETSLQPNASVSQLESALSQAYTSSTYLTGRRQNLALLDSYGKNAWLVGNWQLETELKALEKEVADAKREIDLVTIRRQQVQRDVAGEMDSLAETWRKGVGRVLETEIAAEGVRREVLEERRRLAEERS